jgi:hypothetical protein
MKVQRHDQVVEEEKPPPPKIRDRQKQGVNRQHHEHQPGNPAPGLDGQPVWIVHHARQPLRARLTAGLPLPDGRHRRGRNQLFQRIGLACFLIRLLRRRAERVTPD